MKRADCIFCQKRAEGLENELAKAFLDQHPVRPGHLLIVPKDHYATYFDVPMAVRCAMDDLLVVAKHWLDQTYQPDGYNLGINVGPVAGQTVMHAHLHVIPRYLNDVPDPRGGIREMLPESRPSHRKDEDNASA